jgi:hypothetical protein
MKKKQIDVPNLKLYLPQVLEFVAEGRVQRRRRNQKPLPQRILDLMKDANPNEAHQGIVYCRIYHEFKSIPITSSLQGHLTRFEFCVN